MNKKILILLALLSVAVTFGQRRPDREKIKSLKVAFLTDRLDLSSKEAEAFWPIYNNYEEDRNTLRQKKRTEVHRKLRESENLSENDAKKILNQYLVIEEHEEELERTFIEDVSKVISAKKVLLLLRSEEDFKRQLIKQYRKKHGGGFR